MTHSDETAASHSVTPVSPLGIVQTAAHVNVELDPPAIYRNYGRTSAVLADSGRTMNKKFRLSISCLAAALYLTAMGARAQVSVQPMRFILVGEFQTNILSGTNTATTNQASRIRNILIGTISVVRSMAIDLNYTNSVQWFGASLVREVNLTNGAEGIFLRKNGLQTNVSSFFGNSFSNNFTATLTNAFPGATNYPGVSNLTASSFQLHRGSIVDLGASNAITNYTQSAGLYSVSFNSTNMKFNLIGVGTGTIAKVGPAAARQAVQSEILGTAGSFYLNVTSNIFNEGVDVPVFSTGPIRGTFVVAAPTVLNNITNGP